MPLRRLVTTTTAQPQLPLNEAKIKQLEEALESEKRRTSTFVNALGGAAALLLIGAFIDETINVVVGISSSSWESVEGEIVSEPVVAFAGAMLPRREVGIRYRYFVQPGEDDENKDEPGAGHFEEDSLFATPRKGLMTGLVDFFREPDPTGPFGRELAALYPVGSKVTVFYNSEAPNRACLVPGLPAPDGSLRVPFYLMGVPFLMALARSRMALPVRFSFFALAVLLWTELSEESESVFYSTSLRRYVAKPINAHPPLLGNKD